MLAARLKAYVLFGGIEPSVDLAGDADALNHADLLIAVTTHVSEHLKSTAHIVLPIGCFAESAGTFVNIEGRWQSWQGAAKLVGESRPGWKVLRVLANLLGVPDTDFDSAEEVRAALATLCGNAQTAPLGEGSAMQTAGDLGAAVSADAGWIDLPPYQGDVLVRGSEALAKTQDGQLARVVL
jgi:NADH-quinone oxidoreductase subunit G